MLLGRRLSPLSSRKALASPLSATSLRRARPRPPSQLPLQLRRRRPPPPRLPRRPLLLRRRGQPPQPPRGPPGSASSPARSRGKRLPTPACLLTVRARHPSSVLAQGAISIELSGTRRDAPDERAPYCPHSSATARLATVEHHTVMEWTPQGQLSRSASNSSAAASVLALSGSPTPSSISPATQVSSAPVRTAASSVRTWLRPSPRAPLARSARRRAPGLPGPRRLRRPRSRRSTQSSRVRCPR